MDIGTKIISKLQIFMKLEDIVLSYFCLFFGCVFNDFHCFGEHFLLDFIVILVLRFVNIMDFIEIDWEVNSSFSATTSPF